LFRFGRNGRRNNNPSEPRRTEEYAFESGERSIRMGHGYFIEERQGAICYEILRRILAAKDAEPVKGYIVSRQHPGLIREKYGMEEVAMTWLATQPGEGVLDPTSLGMLAHAVTEFFSSNASSVVLLDGIEYLVTNNDFRKVARMIEQINDSVMSSRGYFITTVDPRAFDPRELAILERNLEKIQPKGVEEEES
jgi:hypothetical protein